MLGTGTWLATDQVWCWQEETGREKLDQGRAEGSEIEGWAAAF